MFIFDFCLAETCQTLRLGEAYTSEPVDRAALSQLRTEDPEIPWAASSLPPLDRQLPAWPANLGHIPCSPLAACQHESTAGRFFALHEKRPPPTVVIAEWHQPGTPHSPLQDQPTSLTVVQEWWCRHLDARAQNQPANKQAGFW